tara:strand:+ start:223 stop:1041 length:819 start_codon:yes stop_codon:yes gene_type:complete
VILCKRIACIALLFFAGCENSDDNAQKLPSDEVNPEDCDFETSTPPFSGTIFIDPDIITPNDPTTFSDLSYAGTGTRTMYDRRNGGGWLSLQPYLFRANYDDGLTIEIQINPEYGSIENAQIEAEKYAPVIGRLTTELRKDVQTVWIHKGYESFGGGNNNLLIYPEWSIINYERQGILEETLVHEGAHSSLDAYHANNPDWLLAQKLDCNFISDYAKQHPLREDIAESYLTYLAVRYRPDRISPELKTMIESAIPNRIKYFDSQKFNMYPIE